MRKEVAENPSLDTKRHKSVQRAKRIHSVVTAFELFLVHFLCEVYRVNRN